MMINISKTVTCLSTVNKCFLQGYRILENSRIHISPIVFLALSHWIENLPKLKLAENKTPFPHNITMKRRRVGWNGNIRDKCWKDSDKITRKVLAWPMNGKQLEEEELTETG